MEKIFNLPSIYVMFLCISVCAIAFSAAAPELSNSIAQYVISELPEELYEKLASRKEEVRIKSGSESAEYYLRTICIILLLSIFSLLAWLVRIFVSVAINDEYKQISLVGSLVRNRAEKGRIFVGNAVLLVFSTILYIDSFDTYILDDDVFSHRIFYTANLFYYISVIFIMNTLSTAIAYAIISLVYATRMSKGA